MEVHIKESNQHAVVHLTGELTIHHVRALSGLIREKCSVYEGCAIDLSEVSSIDSAGAQLLIHLKRFLEEKGIRVRLTEHSSPVIAVMDLYGLAPVFGDKIHIKKEEASRFEFSYGVRKSELAGMA